MRDPPVAVGASALVFLLEKLFSFLCASFLSSLWTSEGNPDPVDGLPTLERREPNKKPVAKNEPHTKDIMEKRTQIA